MPSPITQFAPLGMLQDAGSLVAPVSRAAQDSGSGISGAGRSAEVSWSGTPATTMATREDVYAANANDGIALAQAAGATLGQAANALRGMRKLAHQAGGAPTDQRAALDARFQALGAAVRHALESAQINGRTIFGADAGSTSFRVGPGADRDSLVTVTTHDLLGSDALQAVTNGGRTSRLEAQMVPPALTEYLDNVIEQLDQAVAQIDDERHALTVTELRFGAALGEILDAAQDPSQSRVTIGDARSASSATQALAGQITRSPESAAFALGGVTPLRVLGLLIAA